MVKGMGTWNFLGKMKEKILRRKSRFTAAQIMGVLRRADPPGGRCGEWMR